MLFTGLNSKAHSQVDTAQKMAEPSREKLSSQIVEEFHAAGQKGDVEAFKRLLGKYGAHLPAAVKNDLIADFKKHASLLQKALRKR